MAIRQKTLLAIATTLVGLNAVLYIVSSTLVLRNATNAEEQYMQRSVNAALSVLNQHQKVFVDRWSDWGIWDDPYQFLQDRNPDFVENNLQDAYLANKVNLVVFADRTGHLLFAKSFTPSQRQGQEIAPELRRRLVLGDLLLTASSATPNSRTGIVMLPEGPMLIAAFASLNSAAQGPKRGTILWGRYLNSAELSQLAKSLNLALTVHRWDDPHLPSDFVQARQALLASQAIEPIVVKPLSERAIAGYTLLRDVDHQPVLLLRVENQRVIYQKGQRALKYLIGICLIVGLIFGGLTLLLLERLVLRRLTYLNHEVASIGSRGDLTSRICMSGKDELSHLTESINAMLQALEQHEQQQQQIQAALQEAKEIAELAREQSESLLLNILPQVIADQLKRDHSVPPTYFPTVTILFADIVGFTALATQMSPTELVDILGSIFSTFDRLTEQHGLEKIKTIGDAYMVVGGLPVPRSDHAEAIAQMALDMQREIAHFQLEGYGALELRIGINTGPVVAGVIGIKKFIYDLWGDTVNVASRMESQGLPGKIQVTAATYSYLKEKYTLQERGTMMVKGRGEMTTYWLTGVPANLLLEGDRLT
ncbi:MAG TPA: adenylate/guanylate cyclase domain-containing protein [Allocoleopsis sp.]